MVAILTLTLNPALDLAARASRLRPMHKIRLSGEHFDPGGGGVNVARVAHRLGVPVRALLLAGGPTGALIGELLAAEGVPFETVPIPAPSRIAFNVHEDETGLEYRFVPAGPTIGEETASALLDRARRSDAVFTVASGSLPPGLPPDTYARFARELARAGRRFVLDTSGPALTAAAAEGGMALLKLSLSELESLAGAPLTAGPAVTAAARALLERGVAEEVVVSLGSEGALFVSAHETLTTPAFPVTATSTVGAGDSFLAGFLTARLEGQPPAAALRFANAAGAAAVSAFGTARLDRAAVEAFLRSPPPSVPPPPA
jgi:6-phosphofructokinase 2